jgi:hypothetical protein
MAPHKNRRDVLAYASAAALIGSGVRAQPMPAVSSTVPTGMGAGPLPVGTPWGASLDLSFMTPGTLDPRITFTRASVATYFDATGTLQTAASGAPRWDYDPVAHTLRGLLIEEQRTNLILNSTAVGGWAATGSTFTGGLPGAPDGTSSVLRMSETAATSGHYVTSLYTTAASTVYTVSLFAQAGTDRYLQLSIDDSVSTGAYATFDLQAGVVSGPLTQRGSAVLGAAIIQPVGNGFYRCSIASSIATATSLRVAIILSNVPAPAFAPSYLGSATNYVQFWGMQLEAGASPTSYIPTVGAAVTRAGDACVMTPAAWFSATQGTAATDYSLPYASVAAGNPVLAELDDGTINNIISLRLSAPNQTNGVVIVANTSQGAVANSTGWSAGVPGKAALAYNTTAANLLISVNGSAALTGAVTGWPPTISRFAIGTGRSTQLNGWLRRVRYWPRALSAAELQSVTT